MVKKVQKDSKNSPDNDLEVINAGGVVPRWQQWAAAQDAFGGLGLAQLGRSAPTLMLWAARYMEEEVVGVLAPNTVKAKRSDLSQFLMFFGQLNGHMAAEEWTKRDTRAFLRSLEKLGRAPATVNRMLRTLKRLAHWMHAQPNTPFAQTGLPTAGIKQLEVDEPEAAKLSKREVFQLFKAAERCCATHTRANARPWRNRAILATLNFTGLRVSELVALKLEQWDGFRFHHVRRKGRKRSRFVGFGREGREMLNDYLEGERVRDDDDSPWLFLSTHGDKLTTDSIRSILNRLAEEATRHGGELHLYPHRLRHTFGAAIREKTHSDSETAQALGHAGIQHVGRYARATQAEREEVLDSMTVEGD